MVRSPTSVQETSIPGWITPMHTHKLTPENPRPYEQRLTKRWPNDKDDEA